MKVLHRLAIRSVFLLKQAYGLKPRREVVLRKSRGMRSLQAILKSSRKHGFRRKRTACFWLDKVGRDESILVKISSRFSLVSGLSTGSRL